MPPSLADPVSIALFPFDNLGDDQSLGRVAAGSDEDIGDALGRLAPRLLVVRGLVAPPRGPVRSAATAGSGARLCLAGSVRGHRDRLRVAVRVFESQTGVQVWSEHFDGRREEVLALQDSAAHGVARGMQAWLESLHARQGARVEASRDELRH